jgi:acetyl-CoA acyltransferase
VRADDLGAVPLRAFMARHNLDWSDLDEVIFGGTNQAGEDKSNVARMSALLAGLPDTVPVTTMNRLCGSGLDAVVKAARAIHAEELDFIIAGGVESMSRAPFVMPKADAAFSRAAEVHDTTIGWQFVNPLMKAQYGVDSMPRQSRTSQKILTCPARTKMPLHCGPSKRPVPPWIAGDLCRKSRPRKGGDPVIKMDKHPRPQTTVEDLAKLKTFVKSDGTVAAGNSAGVNDGAAAFIIAS